MKEERKGRKERDTRDHILCLDEASRKGKCIETKGRLETEWESTVHEHEASYWSDENIPTRWQLCASVKLLKITEFHTGNVCEGAQSRPSPCDPTGHRPPGSSVRGIFQARIVEWAAISFPRGSSQPKDQIHSSCISCIGGQILYHHTTWEAPTGNGWYVPSPMMKQVIIRSTKFV